MESESDDSTFEAEEASEEELQEQEYDHEKLTKEELGEIYEQLDRMNQKKKEKQEYFQSAMQNMNQQNVTTGLFNQQLITSIYDGLFAPYATKNVDMQSQAHKEYLEKLKVYQPKLVTIQETRKFWQMYKNSLSNDQLKVLTDYINSNSSYLARKEFLSRGKDKK